MSKENKYVNLSAVRREDQREVMEEIKRQNPILKEGKFWILTENQWPYKKIKHQLLAIYKTHIEHLKEIDPESGKELIEMFAEEAEKRNMKGGGVAMRFGSNPEYGNYGSSVLHIHAHLVEPDLEKLEETEAWRFKFGEPKNYKKRVKASHSARPF